MQILKNGREKLFENFVEKEERMKKILLRLKAYLDPYGSDARGNSSGLIEVLTGSVTCIVVR